MTQSHARIVVAALVLAVLPAACVRTPEVRYYTLSADAPAHAASAGSARYTVRVSPASVPEMLDRPELVLRVSATELAIDDGHRWAEPLRTGIARAIASDLAHELDGALVVLAEEATTTREPVDVEVAIDVHRFDAKMRDSVSIDVTWVARWTDTRSVRTGRTVAHALVAPGSSYDALVVACAHALATLSGDIARSVRAESISRR